MMKILDIRGVRIGLALVYMYLAVDLLRGDLMNSFARDLKKIQEL